MTVSEQLNKNYCAVVKDFITPEQVQVLINAIHERKPSEPQRIKYSTNMNINAFDVYKMPHLWLKLLVEKTAEVSALIEEDVLPTYVYGRIYQNGSTLQRHVDRPACDISVTVNLKQDKQWLIAAENPDKKVTAFDLSVGDAMLYYGCNAPHWREGAYTGTEYIQIFMHYVRINGPHVEHFFDKLEK